MTRLTGGLRIIGRRRLMYKTKLIALTAAAATLAVMAPCSARAADRPIEIGGGVGTVGSWFASGPFSGADLRIGIPAGRGGDVEMLVAMQAPEPGETFGFYGAQYRQRLPTSGRSRFAPFLTYGMVGVFYRERNESMVTPPVIGLVGIGFEERLSRRLAVRVDTQGVMALIIPVGVRVAAGVSIPIGRLPADAR
jgi:hypothetical protein